MSFLLVIFVLVFSTGPIKSKHYLVKTGSNESVDKEAGKDYVDFTYSLNTKGNDYENSVKQEEAELSTENKNCNDTKSAAGQGKDDVSSFELEQFSKNQEEDEVPKFVAGQGNDYASSQELDQFLKDQEKELEEFLFEKEKETK